MAAVVPERGRWGLAAVVGAILVHRAPHASGLGRSAWQRLCVKKMAETGQPRGGLHMARPLPSERFTSSLLLSSPSLVPGGVRGGSTEACNPRQSRS